MASGGPAGFTLDERGVIEFAHKYLACGELDLGMAFETERVVALGKQFGVDRPVRLVAGDTAFAQGFVFKRKGSRLFPVAGRARFVQARHGKSARGLEGVPSMRVVALHATHLSLDDRMMIRQVHLRFHVDVALKTGGGIPAGIDDEFSTASACRDVFASRTVAGFAPRRTGSESVVSVKQAVWAGRENPRDCFVAVDASGISREAGSCDRWWLNRRVCQARTGTCQETSQRQESESHQAGYRPPDHKRTNGLSAAVRQGGKAME